MPKSSIDEIEKNAKRLLEILGDQPKRRTEWSVSAAMGDNLGENKISFNQFNFLLLFLLRNRCVDRLERGVYRITDLGKQQLVIWEKCQNY